MFFGDLLEKGQNALKWPENDPPEGGKPKTRKNHGSPPYVPPKTAFFAIFRRYGRDHNFGRFLKNALFSPFLGGPKTPQKRRFRTFQVLKKI